MFEEVGDTEIGAEERRMTVCRSCVPNQELEIHTVPVIASPGYGSELKGGVEAVCLVCPRCGRIYAEGQRYTGSGVIVWIR